ncbi:fungal specific transcription factor domain-containing [Trichoderma arundinaceum]|uniref:Fungal specific transcription factor domain-containing n=1 Tax=Trichoderma arundinaceum TaxID=490622 RepID=A0A395NIT2_TRIAR|nr:fungal specific transcription factor domain-containing [Trichoderma arundinaceum]
MPRRRASKACLHCRQRKVRCDVTLRGVPCLNCQLDHQLCAVQERKSKRSLSDSKLSAQHDGGSIIEGISTRMSHDNPSGIDSIDQWAKRLSGFPPLSLKGLSISAYDVVQNDTTTTESTCMNLEGFSPKTASTISNLHNKYRTKEKLDAYNALADQPSASIEGIGYSSHDTLPFIRTPELGHVSALDIRFMQLNGCFDLPPMPILNEFVRMFFLHVHPIVPLFNEGEFWESFSCTNGEKISLLVFQAIIFAACAFIPGAIAEATGFDCPRAATAAFYKKAKILYDFEIESNPIALGQAALLFTFWPGALRPGPAKSNSAWLSIAIRHAKSLRAHHLTANNASLNKQNIPPQTRISLRRLWWCCYIRDRIISLGLRRTLRIPEKYPPLVLEDFEDEIHRSRVYNAESKRRFVDIFMQISKLCVVVTDLLRLCSISEDGLECETNVADHQQAVANCTSQLQEWYDAAKKQFPDDAERPGIQPHFVIIQTNLMFTYYFAAFVAMPLMIQIINAKILARGVVNPRAAMHRQQLHSLISLVKQCHPRLDGIDAVCMTIRRLTDLAHARFISGHTSQITECIDLIDYKPLEYLRLFLNLDLNLSNATMLDNIQFLELKEELLRTKEAPSVSDSHIPTPSAELNPSSEHLTESSPSSLSSKQQDTWDLNLPEAKGDSLVEIDDSLLNIEELLGGDGTLGVDPSLIALESLPLMNQHMEWEMDAWLLGET